VEELLLGAVLAGQELDVVDQEHVDRPVLVPDLGHVPGLDGGDDLVHELLGGHVGDPLLGEALAHLVADRVHEVGLAQAHAAIEEERVVVLAGRVGHRHGRGMGEAGVVADHEGAELELLVELGAGGLRWLLRHQVLDQARGRLLEHRGAQAAG